MKARGNFVRGREFVELAGAVNCRLQEIVERSGFVVQSIELAGFLFLSKLLNANLNALIFFLPDVVYLLDGD